MTLRPLHALATVGALALVLAGCGGISSGPRATEDRSIGQATAVELATSGTLTVTRGAAPSLTITAGERDLKHLTSVVHNDVLVLGSDGGAGWGVTGSIAYHLVLPELSSLTVSGSGDVHADSTTGRELEIRVSGSGSVDIAGISADAVTVTISGSGDVRLAGETSEQKVAVAGSGSYLAGSMTSDSATVEVAGSGDAHVRVTSALDASVAGSGSVSHTGGARVTSRTTGSGHVREG